MLHKSVPKCARLHGTAGDWKMGCTCHFFPIFTQPTLVQFYPFGDTLMNPISWNAFMKASSDQTVKESPYPSN